MTAFHDVRLPEDVERGAKGGPRFQTSVIAFSNGGEQRNIDWAKARARFDIGYGIDGRSEFERIISFFRARRGRAYGFRFKDWSDYNATDEALGVGDGANAAFQLLKTYEPSGPLAYVRKITRPVAASIAIKVSGVTSTFWTLGALGVITFTGGHIPALAAPVTATYEFDIPVRFDIDEFDLTLEMYLAGEIESIPVIELRE